MTINPHTAAILDRLTDPVPNAVQEIRDQLDQLAGMIAGLKTATDSDGEECADELWSLAHHADLAAEDLKRLLVP